MIYELTRTHELLGEACSKRSRNSWRNSVSYYTLQQIRFLLGQMQHSLGLIPEGDELRLFIFVSELFEYDSIT